MNKVILMGATDKRPRITIYTAKQFAGIYVYHSIYISS